MDTAWVNDIPVRIKKQSGGLIVGYIPEGVTLAKKIMWLQGWTKKNVSATLLFIPPVIC